MMHNEIIYYCPKCKSLNIEFKCLKPTEPLMISIDYIIDDRLVSRNCEYLAKCEECGYEVKYIR